MSWYLLYGSSMILMIPWQVYTVLQALPPMSRPSILCQTSDRSRSSLQEKLSAGKKGKTASNTHFIFVKSMRKTTPESQIYLYLII